MHAYGRIYDRMDMGTFQGLGGWLQVIRQDIPNSPRHVIKDLPANVSDVIRKSKEPPVIYPVRQSTTHPRDWTQHQTSSVHQWTTEHGNVFGVSMRPKLVVHIHCLSRNFPLVPSDATAGFLEKELELNLGQRTVFSAVEWTQRIAGAIEMSAAGWPTEKPILASFYNGFTCNIALLGVFLLSTSSFYLDVKVIGFYNDRMATEMWPPVWPMYLGSRHLRRHRQKTSPNQ
jgi:hypothetical protein